jgi:glyoxylase-like metal-dependent hydrolase (beta-lactamase superfamily II)
MLSDGQQLEIGQAIIEVVHCPGHTPGSAAILVAVDGMRALFVGDAVHGLYFPASGRDASADMMMWADSLERLAACEFDFMFEGHVLPVHVLGNLSALSANDRTDLYSTLERRMAHRRLGTPADEAREIIRSQAAASRAQMLITPEPWIMELAAQMQGGPEWES